MVSIIHTVKNFGIHSSHTLWSIGKTFTVWVDVYKRQMRHLAEKAGGDVRKALNSLELAVMYTPPDSEGNLKITMELAEQCTQKKSFKFDKKGDSQYDVMSALQKSIRGSDPDAAVHYLARLVEADDIQSICRRLMVIACEDIGLAYPQAITIVKACVDSALMLGFPEARIPLAEAAVLLATAPKSNSAYMAINNAIRDIETIDTGSIPRQLQNKHYDGCLLYTSHNCL